MGKFRDIIAACRELLTRIVHRLWPERPVSLGRDRAGRRWQLHPRTGAITPVIQGRPLRAATDSAPSAKDLRACFTAAGYATDFDEDGDLLVETDVGAVWVFGDRRQLLRFVRPFAVATDLGRRERVRLASALNATGLVARYVYQPDEEALVAEYDLPTGAGVTDAQCQAALRAFVTAVAVNLSKQRALRVLL